MLLAASLLLRCAFLLDDDLCLLCSVCCGLFGAGWLLRGVCRVLFVAMFAVRCVLSVGRCLLFVVCLLCGMRCLLFLFVVIAGLLLFVVC